MAPRPQREGIMLAYPVDAGRLSRLGNNFFTQPKINGERGYVEWFHGEPVILSSYGNEFPYLYYLKESLKLWKKEHGEIPLDGELYVHGWTRERIDAALRTHKKEHPDNQGIEFHIFDIAAPDMMQAERLLYLQGVDDEFFQSPIRRVSTYLANQSDWMDYAKEFLTQGYEGSILRKIDRMWRPKRDVGLLKFKPTETDEYTILGVNEAVDKDGNPKSMVGSFIVKSKTHDQQFSVGAGKMKHFERVHYWFYRDTIIGKTLIVKQEMNITSGGVPLCAVALEIKDTENVNN